MLLNLDIVDSNTQYDNDGNYTGITVLLMNGNSAEIIWTIS